jgi:hypothetical protein
MKFDKKYWILIAWAVIAHGIALALTWYYFKYVEECECNNIMATIFAKYGVIMPGILSLIVITLIMIAIPYLYKENEKFAKQSAILLLILCIGFSIDAASNILVVTNNPLKIIPFTMIKTLYTLVGAPFNC